MTKSNSDLYKSVGYIVLALAITTILYYVNGLSLQDNFAFTTYSLLGLFCLCGSFKLCKSKKFIVAFLVFEITYLSVYLLSILLSLNTSLFDFIKGVAFSFVVFSLLACIKYVFNRITSGANSHILKSILSILYFVFVFVGLFFQIGRASCRERV